jgi:hypothetical protein
MPEVKFVEMICNLSEQPPQGATSPEGFGIRFLIALNQKDHCLCCCEVTPLYYQHGSKITEE